MSNELDEIGRDIALLAQRIGAAGPEVPTVGFTANTGLPCVMEEAGAFVWLTMDSGREVSRETLTSRDDVLFRALDTMAYSVANRYAIDHRVPGVQYWAVLFKKYLDVVRSTEHRWYVRACADVARQIEANTADGGLNSYVKELLAECVSATASTS